MPDRLFPLLPPLSIVVRRPLPCLSNVYANDSLGDCTAAGAGHIMGIWRGYAGTTIRLLPADQVIQFYSQTTGYVPGNPATDQGGDEVTVLNSWKDKGFFADGKPARLRLGLMLTRQILSRSAKLSGWRRLCTSGFELPDAWVSPMPQTSGFIWDVAGDPVPQNGHCFIAGSP